MASVENDGRMHDFPTIVAIAEALAAALREGFPAHGPSDTWPQDSMYLSTMSAEFGPLISNLNFWLTREPRHEFNVRDRGHLNLLIGQLYGRRLGLVMGRPEVDPKRWTVLGLG
jgi:hypothetical protein